MAFLGAIIIAAGFVLLMNALRLFKRSMQVLKIAKSAIDTVSSKHFDDYQKEKALQRHAKALFIHFFIIGFGSVISLALPFLCI